MPLVWSNHARSVWPHPQPDPATLLDVTHLAAWLHLSRHPGLVLYDPATRWLLLVGERWTVVTAYEVRSRGERCLIDRIGERV